MNDTWQPWSEELLKIPYEKTKDVGPGEYRVAALFQTKPNGQNVPYDINLPPSYEKRQGEVKELDSAKSFQPGRDGRDRLRPIKNLLMSLLDIFNILLRDFHKELTETQIKSITVLSDISPDEICKTNINRISELCNSLGELRGKKLAAVQSVTLFDSLTGQPTETTTLMAYHIMKAENKPEGLIKQKIGESQLVAVTLVATLNHTYITEPKKFMLDLNGLCAIFQAQTLIFVNKKGYYILCADLAKKITFERITKGYPRFKAHLQ
jgi:hypothetical protein